MPEAPALAPAPGEDAPLKLGRIRGYTGYLGFWVGVVGESNGKRDGKWDVVAWGRAGDRWIEQGWQMLRINCATAPLKRLKSRSHPSVEMHGPYWEGA